MKGLNRMEAHESRMEARMARMGLYWRIWSIQISGRYWNEHTCTLKVGL